MVPAQLTTDQAAFDFNPMTSPHREDPHGFYRAARGRPVTFSPSIGAYMVTRYADLVTVLDDPQTYSSKAALPMIYDSPPEVVAVLKAGHVPETTMVVNEDEPEHIRFRRVFDAGFTGARVRAMVPLMRERATGLIDRFAGRGDGSAGGRADLVADYAIPFVQAVISAVIGFPAEDTAQIQAWTDDVNMLWNMLAPVDARVESARRMADYTRYLQALIDDRRAHPREDLISDLVHGAHGYPGLPDEYVHNMIRGAARVAGFDTTRDAITATVLIMLQTPGVRDRVLADPARTIPKLTEEVLRRDAPHRGLFRITTRAVELGGTTLPAGAPMLLLFGSGNRDETVFADPDGVDLDRPSVRDHLAFGRGLHSCPGAPMARAEIRVALETLIRRLPGLQLADGYRPTYIASYFFRGLESLEVTWLPSKNRIRRDAPMHVLTVCYGHPADPAAFDAYYASTHRPLAEKVPGLVSFTARHCESLDGSAPPYYLLAELAFASREVMDAGLASPEGQAAAADVANFADGGATMFVARD